ncbi:ADP-ribosylglycohydrolase family protein [Kitasatospora sp. NPDC001095]
MTVQPNPHPWHDRAAGTLLAAAVGDALGWPFERRDRTRPLGDISGARGFVPWQRLSGARRQLIPEHIGAGEYSDDTQMTIAVARARLTSGKHWQSWLERVEWPFLLDYERGAGASVKSACRAWARGRAPWESSATAVSRYFDTGANGAAMRIAPHVLAHSQDLRFDELAVDIVRDAATTHGHPRALLGALVHAYALWISLREPAPLPYGWLVDTLLSDAENWQKPYWQILSDPWQEQASKHFNGHFDQAWSVVATEVEQLLIAAQLELKGGAVSAPTVFLAEQGLTSPKSRGSGTLCAVAAAYLAARSAASPDLGLSAAARLDGADTDTLASMTGALLGAALGIEWLGPYGRLVQDRDLLVNLAEALLQTQTQAPMRPPTSEQASRARAVFMEQLSGIDGTRLLRLPDRRNARVSPGVGGDADNQWLVAVTEDGQTLFLRRAGARQPALFDLEVETTYRGGLGRAPVQAHHVSAQLQGAYLQVADIVQVRQALGDVFGLFPERYGSAWAAYGNLVLAQDTSFEHPQAQINAQLRIVSVDIGKTLQLLAAHGRTVAPGKDGRTFQVQIDPYLSVVFAAAGDRRAPRWDSSF